MQNGLSYITRYRARKIVKTLRERNYITDLERDAMTAYITMNGDMDKIEARHTKRSKRGIQSRGVTRLLYNPTFEDFKKKIQRRVDGHIIPFVQRKERLAKKLEGK